MKCQPQRERCEDHVHQSEIQDAPRVSIRRPRIDKKQERCQHADGSDRIAQRQADSLRVAVPHRLHCEATQDGSDDPQAGDDERHDAQAS
jgi:hypothetical protein